MKKPVLGGLAVAGACAACCAIPLAVPLISGASAAGLTWLIDWERITVDSEVLAIGAGLGAVLLVGGGLWWSGRRNAAACRVEEASPAVESSSSASAGSGCACAATSAPGAKP